MNLNHLSLLSKKPLIPHELVYRVHNLNDALELVKNFLRSLCHSTLGHPDYYYCPVCTEKHERDEDQKRTYLILAEFVKELPEDFIEKLVIEEGYETLQGFAEELSTLSSETIVRFQLLNLDFREYEKFDISRIENRTPIRNFYDKWRSKFEKYLEEFSTTL